MIYYNINHHHLFVQEKSKQTSDASLIPIVTEHFRRVQLGNDCTVHDFMKRVKPQRCNMFLELNYIEKDKKIIDVILIEKVVFIVD